MLGTATECYISHYWLLPSDDVASEKADKDFHFNSEFWAAFMIFGH